MHVAARVLPLPARLAAEQPEIVLLPLRKVTVPVGAAPVTLAVNVTGEP